MKNNMKINILRIILVILLIGTFGIIFGFSSQDAKQSSGVSKKVTEAITSGIKSIQEKPQNEKIKILSKIEHIIRKIAHFSIYTVVGILLMSLCKTFNIKEINRLSISLIIGVIYASSDEIHQCFTPGRGPQVTDVIIDTMGVLLGILLVMLVVKVYVNVTEKKKNDKKLQNEIIDN